METDNVVLIKYRGRYDYGEDIVAVAVDIETAIIYAEELKTKYSDAYGSGRFIFEFVSLIE